MNIYKYYNKPQELKWYEEAQELVPDLFWDSPYSKYTPAQIRAIAKDPLHAYLYVINVLKDRWPQAEPYIMKNPWTAYLYTRDVIKNRWPQAEPYIMKNPEYAYHYASEVIKGRWPEAEPIIIKTPTHAYLYARDVLKKRWPEAEPYIKHSDAWWTAYKKLYSIK